MSTSNKIFGFVIVVLTFYGCMNKSSDEFHKILQDDWENTLKEYPLFATYYGDHRFNDKLGDVSLAGENRRIEQNNMILKRLNEIDRGTLSESDQLNYDLFRNQLENSLAESAFKNFLMPITNRGGFHVSFPQLPDRIPLKNVNDFENEL